MFRWETLCVLLLISCANTSGGPGASSSLAAEGGTCSEDSICSTGFCDLGSCRKPSKNSGYGNICDFDSLSVYAKADTCGAFVCLGGRCRECTTDEQCGARKDPIVACNNGRCGARECNNDAGCAVFGGRCVTAIPGTHAFCVEN